jgi:uncharacterized protein GlcG (DUF336 family)
LLVSSVWSEMMPSNSWCRISASSADAASALTASINIHRRQQGKPIGGIGVGGAPGGNFDDDCARAALDKIKDRMK